MEWSPSSTLLYISTTFYSALSPAESFIFFVLVCVFLVSDSESGEAFSLASASVQVRERGSPLFPDASKEKRRACNGGGGGATTPK